MSSRDLPRRTLDELIAIHRVETSFHDILVEGPSDRDVVDWFVSETVSVDARAYEIELFEIDPQVVLGLRLENNNRGRVIAAASRIAEELGEKTKVTCIADRDSDALLGVVRPYGVLLLTDFSCMLMYLFNAKVLGKFLRLALPKFNKRAPQIIKELSEALRLLFAARLANEVLHLGLKSVDWRDCCTLGKNRVVLDIEEYSKRYLNKNRQTALKAQFSDHTHQFLQLMKLDDRLQIRGHDFIAILIWYIAQHKGFRSFARKTHEEIERALFSCAELNDLKTENMFKALLLRLAY